VQRKDEYGKLSASCFSLPFVFVTSDVCDNDVVKTEIERQFGIADIKEFSPVFATSFRTDSTSAMFYYVKLCRSVKVCDTMHEKWVLPETILKESFGISCEVIDAYLKSKIQVLY